MSTPHTASESRQDVAVMLKCCKCGQRTRKFTCPMCKHRLCCSCTYSPTVRKRNKSDETGVAK